MCCPRPDPGVAQRGAALVVAMLVFALVAALMVAVGVATPGAFASEAAAVPQNSVLFFSVKDP